MLLDPQVAAIQYRLRTLLIVMTAASVVFAAVGYAGITVSAVIAMPILAIMAMFLPPIIGAIAGAWQRSPFKAFVVTWMSCIVAGVILSASFSAATSLATADQSNWRVQWDITGLVALGGTAVVTGLMASVPTIAYVVSRENEGGRF